MRVMHDTLCELSIPFVTPLLTAEIEQPNTH
jgi:hypothetical protein